MLCNILQKCKHSAKQAIPFILIQYTYMAYITQGGLLIYAAIIATMSPFMLRITTKEALEESLRAYLILNSSSRKEGKSDIVLLKNSITSNSDSDTISDFILQFNF